MRYDVALAACKSYEDAEVSAALETAVTAAGGLDWVTPGMRVALIQHRFLKYDGEQGICDE